MKINFKIDKASLATKVFSVRAQNSQRFTYWGRTEKSLWKRYNDNPALYLVYPKHIDWALSVIKAENKSLSKSLQIMGKNAEIIYKEIFKSAAFRKTLKETEQYLKKIELQWRQHEKFVFNYIKKTLGITLPQKTVTVIVFHPEMSEGRASPRNNLIFWGHREDWENYSTIYIAHELLHILTHRKLLRHDLMHTLIELAADQELRIQLNKKGAYFKEGKDYVGHKHLRKLAKAIIPYWNEYVKNPTSIFDLEKRLIKTIK